MSREAYQTGHYSLIYDHSLFLHYLKQFNCFMKLIILGIAIDHYISSHQISLQHYLKQFMCKFNIPQFITACSHGSPRNYTKLINSPQNKACGIYLLNCSIHMRRFQIRALWLTMYLSAQSWRFQVSTTWTKKKKFYYKETDQNVWLGYNNEMILLGCHCWKTHKSIRWRRIDWGFGCRIKLLWHNRASLFQWLHLCRKQWV